jgi:hypothetical protein
MVAILFRPFGFIAQQIICPSNISILSVPDYSRNTSCALDMISMFHHYHWVDTTAGGHFFPEAMIRQVFSVSALACFNRYIYYCNLQFLNNVMINKTKVLLPHA